MLRKRLKTANNTHGRQRIMIYIYKELNDIANKCGESFYILDKHEFENNYRELLDAFQKYYNNTHIAYSYKTNYIPQLCNCINKNNGFAEIVSEMEMNLALKIGVLPERIFYNGPYKKKEFVEKLILLGGYVNLDNFHDVEVICEIAKEHPEQQIEIGIRCNLNIGKKNISRFGFDYESGIFNKAINKLNSLDNVKVVGFHSHLPYRDLKSFGDRMEIIQKILNSMQNYEWKYISVGGGYMGKIDPSMEKQFDFPVPTYEDYAKTVAGKFEEIFEGMDKKPMLIIEPGSAIVASAMKYVVKVIDIKKISNKFIATLTGSSYNINPSVKGMNRPIEVVSLDSDRLEYTAIDMVGYTCIEDDYLYKGYSGKLGEGDFVIFNNVGSYSVVMKPPFILPDVPIVEKLETENYKIVATSQEYDDIFKRFERKYEEHL